MWRDTHEKRFGVGAKTAFILVSILIAWKSKVQGGVLRRARRGRGTPAGKRKRSKLKTWNLPGNHQTQRRTGPVAVYVCRNDGFKDVRVVHVDRRIGWKGFLQKCQKRLRMRRCLRAFHVDGRELDFQAELPVDTKRVSPLILTAGENYAPVHGVSNPMSSAPRYVPISYSDDRFTHALIIRVAGEKISSAITQLQDLISERINLARSLKAFLPATALYIPLAQLRCSGQSAAKLVFAIKAFQEKVATILSASTPHLLLTLKGMSLTRNGKVLIGVRRDKYCEALLKLRESLRNEISANCGQGVISNKKWIPHCVAVKLRNDQKRKTKRTLNDFIIEHKDLTIGSTVCYEMHLISLAIEKDTKAAAPRAFSNRNYIDATGPRKAENSQVIMSIQFATPPDTTEVCQLISNLQLSNPSNAAIGNTAEMAAEATEISTNFLQESLVPQLPHIIEESPSNSTNSITAQNQGEADMDEDCHHVDAITEALCSLEIKSQ